MLEDRVWCHPEQGSPGLCDGRDHFYAFGSHAEVQSVADRTAGAEAPLALMLQSEYIDEPEDGCFVHVRPVRITEWPVTLLRRPTTSTFGVGWPEPMLLHPSGSIPTPHRATTKRGANLVSWGLSISREALSPCQLSILTVSN